MVVRLSLGLRGLNGKRRIRHAYPQAWGDLNFGSPDRSTREEILVEIRYIFSTSV